MKLSQIGELSLLEIIRKRFRTKKKNLALGIGDDSAVIKPQNENMLLTTDMMVEGVHFDLSWITPYQLGFKLVSVNVSDIYAMGGNPKFLLLNFAASKDMKIDFLNQLFNGIENALQRYKLALIGGDISSSEKIVLSATVSGYASKYISRKGARIGDKIYVTGKIGDSSCGLALMKLIKKTVEIEKGKKRKFPLNWSTVYPLIKRHLMPVARSPREFKDKATSMIDISDGLLIDLSRICKESAVGAKIYIDKIPVSAELKKAAGFLGLFYLDMVFEGGEDYEMLFTAPGHEQVDAYCIGEVIRPAGLKLIDEKGKGSKVSIKGYQHFAL